MLTAFPYPVRSAEHLHQQTQETRAPGKSSRHRLSHTGTKSFPLTPEPGRRATWGLFSWPGCKPAMTCYSFVSMNKLLSPAPCPLPLPPWPRAGCLSPPRSAVRWLLRPVPTGCDTPVVPGRNIKTNRCSHLPGFHWCLLLRFFLVLLT